jgi:hypothetical protein
MNGSVAGGTLATGDAGKPGAPEDAARASMRPQGVRVRGRLLPLLRGLSGEFSPSTDRNTPSFPYLLPPSIPALAGRQRQRHLLVSAQGLWRNHWLWEGGGVSRSSTVTTTLIRVIITLYVLSTPQARRFPSSFRSNPTASETSVGFPSSTTSLQGLDSETRRQMQGWLPSGNGMEMCRVGRRFRGCF